MKPNQIKLGQTVLMPSPVAMLKRRRSQVKGRVIGRYRIPNAGTIFQVWARSIEPKQMAGWHSAGELAPA